MPTAIRVDQDRGRKMHHRDRVQQRKHTGDSSLVRRALVAAARTLTRWIIDKRRTMTTTTAEVEVEVEVEAGAALSHTAAIPRQARPTSYRILTPPPRLRIPITPSPVPPQTTARLTPSTTPKPTPTALATAGTSFWATR